MRHAIENDIFESIAGCPLMGTHRLVSMTTSNFIHVLFTPRSYEGMMKGILRMLPVFNMNNLDELISPAAFSSFLAYIYENVTRTHISASQCKVEAFLTGCFKSKSANPHGNLLCDAFFDGRVETSGGDSAALSAILDSAPYKSHMESAAKTKECGHDCVPRFAKSHLFSPPVTHCSICGCQFLNQREISTLKNARSERDKIAFAQNMLPLMKERRLAHFAKVFGTGTEFFQPTAQSSLTCLHESVRLACSSEKFKDAKVPTRELVLAVLARILDRAEPGCPYSSSFLNFIVLALSDYLHQREAWYASGRAPVGDALLSLQDRLILEVDAGDVCGIDVINDSGIDPNLLKDLTAPVQFDAVAENVAKSSDKEDGDGDK